MRFIGGGDLEVAAPNPTSTVRVLLSGVELDEPVSFMVNGVGYAVLAGRLATGFSLVRHPAVAQWVSGMSADGAVGAVAMDGPDVDLYLGSAGEVSGDPAEISDVVTLRTQDGEVEPSARDLVAVQRDGSDWRVVGSARSDGEDGTYTISGLVDPGADVYLMALDDLGAVFEADAPVEADALIHPTTPNGYVYRVVTAGDLPGEEPDWWTTGQQQVGTATLAAREYLRPLAHGPVDVTWL